MYLCVFFLLCFLFILCIYNAPCFINDHYIGYSYCNICEGTSVVLDAAYMYIDLCVCAICSGFIMGSHCYRNDSN